MISSNILPPAKRVIPQKSLARYQAAATSLIAEALASNNPAVITGAREIMTRMAPETVREFLAASSPEMPELGREPFNVSPEELDRSWGQQ
jgi:hypothetical protein